MRAVGAIEPGRLGLPDGQRPPDRDFRANHYATMRRTLLSAYRHLEGSSCVERRRSKREGPLWASVGKARPRPGSFSPRLPPLPTGEATDEAQEAELLQAVEQQFKECAAHGGARPGTLPFRETVEVVEAEPAPKPQPDHSPQGSGTGAPV